MQSNRQNISHLWQPSEIFQGCEEINYAGMDHSEWEALRWSAGGLGGSDVGVVAGLTEYGDRNVLLLHCVGYRRKAFTPTTLTLWGHETEENMAKWYRHYEGAIGQLNDQQVLVNNLLQGREVNTVIDLPIMIRRPDAPFLIGNVDRFCVEHYHYPGPGVVELKSTSTQYAQQFIASIPPQHIAQAGLYCWITGLEWFAIVQTFDNCRRFEVTHMEMDDSYMKTFMANRLEQIAEFWSRVEKGREIFANAKNDQQALVGLMEIMYESANEEWRKFLTEKQAERRELAEVEGTEEVLKMALNFHDYDTKKSRNITGAEIQKNKIRSLFVERGIRKMTFEDGPVKSISFHKQLRITKRNEHDFWN